MKLDGYDNINTGLELSEKVKSCIPDFITSLQKYSEKTPVKSIAIEQGLGLSGVEVRDLVRFLRRKGYPIGSNSRGYYWIRKQEELNRCLRHLEERKTSLENTIKDMKCLNLNQNIYTETLFSN